MKIVGMPPTCASASLKAVMANVAEAILVVVPDT
jgi:hypothetical protein